jgi:hypothetical protein
VIDRGTDSRQSDGSVPWQITSYLIGSTYIRVNHAA